MADVYGESCAIVEVVLSMTFGCRHRSLKGGRMYIEEDTLDDAMHEILRRLLAEKEIITASRGDFKEFFGAFLHLRNPRARLSRSEGKGKIFSALGEFLWYLSGDTKLDFIDYYVPRRFKKESDDQVRVRSGYGDRLLNWRNLNQLENVVSLLKGKPSTRRAVIQLFDAEDLVGNFKSIPCTCTLQFLIRGDALHLIASMRSNDAYIGLPHDVFSFTMLQELIARSIGLELGEYKHSAGSLHLYSDDFASAQAYLDEGYQSKQMAMPPMPQEEPWESIMALQAIEKAIRGGEVVDLAVSSLDEYWKDLARLLQAYSASKHHDVAELERLKIEMHSRVYRMFIEARADMLSEKPLTRIAGV